MEKVSVIEEGILNRDANNICSESSLLLVILERQSYCISKDEGQEC
jgi:hypothetical protein